MEIFLALYLVASLIAGIYEGIQFKIHHGQYVTNKEAIGRGLIFVVLWPFLFGMRLAMYISSRVFE